MSIDQEEYGLTFKINVSDDDSQSVVLALVAWSIATHCQFSIGPRQLTLLMLVHGVLLCLCVAWRRALSTLAVSSVVVLDYWCLMVVGGPKTLPMLHATGGWRRKHKEKKKCLNF